MRWIPVAALCVAVVLAPPAAADAGIDGPPFIDHTIWVSYSGLSSLRVYPTKAGRDVAGQTDKTPEQTDEAWLEVLELAPDADTPGMRAQFVCHWDFAEFADPGKTSWNLEPWRQTVDDNTMVVNRCNPAGIEEPF